MTDLEFDFVDEVPEKGNPVSVDPDGLYCETCGKPLEYGGRGRKPRFCDEHKPSRSNSTAKRGNGPVVDRAIKELEFLYGVAGQGIKFVDPASGAMVVDNADKLAESYRMLLETNAKFRKLFQDMESKAAWLPILAVHSQLIGAIWLSRAMAKAETKLVSADGETVVNGPWPTVGNFPGV